MSALGEALHDTVIILLEGVKYVLCLHGKVALYVVKKLPYMGPPGLGGIIDVRLNIRKDATLESGE